MSKAKSETRKSSSSVTRIRPFLFAFAAVANIIAMTAVADPIVRVALAAPAVLALGYLFVRERRSQRKHQLHLEILADRTTNGIVVTDRHGCVVWCNRGFSALSGYSLNEILSKRPGQLLQGPETDPAVVERIGAKIRRGEGFSERLINYTKAGRAYWVTIDCQPFYNDFGALSGFMAVQSEVTEQVRLTNELMAAAERAQKAERFVRGVLDTIDSHMAILDEQGIIISVNRSWAEFSRQNGGDVPLTSVGVNYLELCDAALDCPQAAQVAQLIRQVRSGVRAQPILYECSTPSQRMWFQVSATAFQQNDTTHIVLVHQEVTGLVETERKLAESRERLELAVSGANLGFWDWDIPSGQTVFGDNWFTILGYEPGELPGSFKTWEVLCHPDDRSQVYAALEECWSKPGSLYRCEHRLRRKDGEYSSILDLGRVAEWQPNGKPLRMVGVHLDVTKERRTNEELASQKDLLELILEVLPVGVFWKDREGRYQGANRAFAHDWLGGQRDEIKGRFTHEVVSPELLPAAMTEAEREVQQSGIAILNRAEVIQLPSGETRWFEQSRVPIRNAKGNIEGILGVARDVTVKRQAILTLERAKMAAVEANQAKSDFLANMSHEIRTPMNGVIGMTELLLDSPLPQEERELAESVLLSARSLLKIINDILDFTKVEARKLTLYSEPFDLHHLIDNVQRLYAHRFEAKGINFSVLRTGAIPTTVRGDSTRLQQVLGNLLVNSVKFTPEGGSVTLQVNGEVVSVHESRLSFSVSDTGIGIPEDKQHHVFEEFWQLDSSASREHGGTGLGLPIARSIVELMGGQIKMRSTPGVGSEFFFALTMERLEGVASCNEISPYPIVPSSRRFSILLAEDNPTNRMLAVALLTKAGHTVVAVEDGAKAVEAAAGQRFDLILMDIQMPVLDGVGAIQQLRTNYHSPNNQTPIIAVTAHAMLGDRERYLAAGANGYVSKPLDRKILLETIDAVCKKPLTEATPAQISGTP